MSAPKDTKIAMSVQQMAAYGYFKEEFLFYGYAFKRGEQIVYKLSERLLNIYGAYNESIFEAVYPTAIHSLLKSAVVPAGEHQVYKTQYKMELVQNLREYYGQPFFDATLLFDTTPPQDTAYELLNEYLKSHILQAEQRQVFDGLCQLALEAKLLSRSAYEDLNKSADRLYGQRLTVTLPLAGRGKGFSGFAYWQQAQTAFPSYYISATLEDSYKKYDRLRRQGICCTPIVQKSYWFDSPNDFKAIRAEFEAFLTDVLDKTDAAYMVDQIKNLPPAVNPQHYQMMLDRLRSTGTPEGVATYSSYGYRFNLL